jgi:hypothetical protein
MRTLTRRSLSVFGFIVAAILVLLGCIVLGLAVSTRQGTALGAVVGLLIAGVGLLVGRKALL